MAKALCGGYGFMRHVASRPPFSKAFAENAKIRLQTWGYAGSGCGVEERYAAFSSGAITALQKDIPKSVNSNRSTSP